MDNERAIEWLTSFRDLATRACAMQDTFGEYYYKHPDWTAVDNQLEGMLLPARRLVAEIDKSLVQMLLPNHSMYSTVWRDASRGAERAIGALLAQPDMDAIIEPGPRLAASGLHPWVWQAAAKLWSDGHRRAAIGAAAESVDSQTKSKVERWDISGAELAGNVWKNDLPRAGEPRLRPAGFTPGTEDYTSAVDGARFFAMGCMKRIRNLVTHRLAEPTEGEALEMLAALSLLARWNDEAVVERV